MELNDIKKLLYKLNIQAELVQINKTGIHYHSHFYETPVSNQEIFVSFVIPLSDIGDAKFFNSMDGKHLIRYIDTFSKEQ